MDKLSLSRFEQTEKNIQDAFVALCREKGSLDIAVSDVAARARIGRSTFYTHYEDIYALMDVLQCTLLEVFQNYVGKAIPAILAQDDDQLASLLMSNASMVRQHKDILLIFIGKNGSPQFIYKIKQMAKHNLRQLFQSHANKYTDYIMEFMVSAFLGLLSYWLESDEPLSYEELSRLLKAILLKGPVAAGRGLL